MSFKVLPARKQCPRCKMIFSVSRFKCPGCNYPHKDTREPITKKDIANFRKWSSENPRYWEKQINDRWNIFQKEKK